MPTLEEIRRRLQKNEEKTRNFMDNAIYPFWLIGEDKTALIRFLPDGNDENPFFWVEKLTINLPFTGTTENETTPLVVRVPCVEMYGMNCPILKEVRTWFSDPDLEETAKKYWKKRSYIFQGFVVDSPFEEENVPENPIRRFILNNSLFNIIKSSLMDPEMESLPIDYEEGRDFRISKTIKGGKYADYSTSKWSIKSRALTEKELEAIETYGLFNLSDFLPAKPDSEDLNDIYDMFVASVNGELFDVEKWKRFLKSNGVSTNSSTTNSETTVSKPKVNKVVSAKKIKEVEEVEEIDEPEEPEVEEDLVDTVDVEEEEEMVVKSVKKPSPSSTKKVSVKTNPDDIISRLKSRLK